MKRTLALLAFLLAWTILPAQTEYRRYDVRSGLSENSILDIMQDRDGCMWFATRDGLNKFNGRDFQAYGSFSTSKESIFAWSLLQHSDGKRIWVSTTESLRLFDPSSGQFSTIGPKDRHSGVHEATYNPENGHLMITSWEGLLEYDDTTLVKVHLPGETVGNVLSAGNGRLILGRGNKVLRFDSFSGSFEEVLTMDAEVTCLYLADEETVMCGSYAGQIASFNLRSGAISFIPHPGLGVNRIHCIFTESPGHFLIGADNGLFHYDAARRILTQDTSSIGTESIYRIFRDRENGLWIGTYFCGIQYLSPKQKHIEWYRDDGRAGTLRGNAVSELVEDSRGNLWIATENAGLNYFDRSSGRFADYTSKSHDNLHALCLDGSRLWIGTFSKGLDCMDLRTGSVRRFDTSDGLPHDNVYSLLKASDGRLYIGTFRGIASWDGERIRKEEKAGEAFTIDLAESADGTLWAACKHYGIRFKKPGGDWESLDAPYAYFSSVFVDRHGDPWFTTEDKGLFRLRGGSLEHIGPEMNLPRAIYYRILEDRDGILWISSHRGIVKYDYARRSSVILTGEDGLQSNQFNFRSSLRTSDGKFWFGGVNGLNAFFPFQIESNTVPPVAAIRSMDVQRDAIRIEFDCYSYVAPSSNRFSWRMKGWQDKWVETAVPEVTLLHLPAGRYNFELKACNNDGVWSTDVASVPITVRPHPLASRAAILIYALLLTGGGILLYRAWKRRKEEKARMLREEENMKRDREAASERIRFFTQIAHEIKTPVSLIQAPLEKVISEGKWDPSIRPDLETMSKNSSRLLELIRQLLDFRKIDQEGYKLSFSPSNLNLLLMDIAERFVPVGGGPSVGLELPDEAVVCSVDEEAITKVVSNLLSNAVKYASSKVQLTLSRDADNVVITVGDDGPGIPKEFRAKVFEPFFRVDKNSSGGVGIGLSLVRLLVEKHSGTIEAGVSPLGGAQVTVTLPYIEGSEKIGTSPVRPFLQGRSSILIVEDNPDMLDFLKRNFEEQYNVATATDGLEALELLKKDPFDLVISDIMMPRMDGFELLRSIREDEMTDYIPFVLLSARDSLDDKILGMERGADAFVEKPFSLDFLKATVANLIEKRQRTQQDLLSNPESRHKSAGFSNADTEWLEKVDALIKERMTTDGFGVENLASELAISQSNLQRRLKGLTGASPVDYIRLIRLKEAASLLREGRYRVGEVCYMVGINNLSYFTKCFKAQFGILPKDYPEKKSK